MPVWMIAWANIRKKKGVAFSMGILILLSAALFNVGLTLLAGIGSFYDIQNDALHGPHYVVRFSGNEYEDEYLEYFQNDSRVNEAETEEAVIMDMASYPDGGALSANFFNLDDTGNLNGFRLKKEHESKAGHGIYVPMFMREMGYKPGSEFSLVFKKQVYSFTVAGYFESTWFNSSVSSLSNFYLEGEDYEDLYAELGGGYLLAVRVHDPADISSLRKDFKEQTDVKIEAVALDSKVMDFSADEMRAGSTMVVTVLSAILFAFSFIIVAVAMITIKFRISNHIESQMHNIGALEALGYTGSQIKWSIALEFLLIGLAGTVAGIASSYVLISAMGTLISSAVGVSWESGGQGGFALISAAFVMTTVLWVSLVSAGRAAKLSPIKALRGGMESHSFKKNQIPLDRSIGGFMFLLAIKNVVFNKKTYGMVAVIFAGVAFASAFALLTYLNLGLDNQVVVKMTGFEISDLLVYPAAHADYEQLESEIREMDGVRKTTLFEASSVFVDEELLTCYVADDYNKMETVGVYEGSFPQYDNEIAVTGVLAKSWGKEIGDTVEVKAGGITAEYVICGLGQTMSNFGRQCFLKLDGMLRVNPSYERRSMQVYLEKGLEADAFIGRIEEQFKVLSPSVQINEDDPFKNARMKAEEKLANLMSLYGVDSAQYAVIADGELVLSGDTGAYQIDRIENNHDMFISNVDSIALASGTLSVIVLTGTLLIITLVLYMVIKSMIVRRRHEFGIYKAIGYTDEQIMHQIAASFMPSAALGILAGCVISCLTVNPLMTVLFSSMGISRMEFAVNPVPLILLGIGIILFSYVISILISSKVKKISVYGLLTEE